MSKGKGKGKGKSKGMTEAEVIRCIFATPTRAKAEGKA